MRRIRIGETHLDVTTLPVIAKEQNTAGGKIVIEGAL